MSILPDYEDPHQRSRNSLDLTSVIASLEPDQLTAAKQKHFCPRRTLTNREKVLFWSLRIYLVFMFGIVLYQVFTTIK